MPTWKDTGIRLRKDSFPSVSRRRGGARARMRRWHLAGGGLLAAACLPYVLGKTLIDLELIVAQPLLRVALLLLSVAVAWLALHRAGLRAALLPGLAGLILMLEVWHFSGVSLTRTAIPDSALRVLTQNVGMDSPAALSTWLAGNPTDLVLLQEVYHVQWDQWRKLAATLGYHLLYRELRRDSGMGEVILSRLPLTPLPPVSGPSRGPRLRYFNRARITYRGRPVEVLSVHLESLPIIRGQRRFFGASRFRLHQAQLLVDALSRIQQPIILGGDLNATPVYRSTRPLRGLLRDAWHQGGLGLGFTYPAAFPLTRIDAVMQRGFRTLSVRVVRLGNSDHRAMYAALELQDR